MGVGAGLGGIGSSSTVISSNNNNNSSNNNNQQGSLSNLINSGLSSNAVNVEIVITVLVQIIAAMVQVVPALTGLVLIHLTV